MVGANNSRHAQGTLASEMKFVTIISTFEKLNMLKNILKVIKLAKCVFRWKDKEQNFKFQVYGDNGMINLLEKCNLKESVIKKLKTGSDHWKVKLKFFTT